MTESPAAAALRYLMQPLDPWLSHPKTEDVAINRPGEAWIMQKGEWIRVAVALDLNALQEIAILAGSLRQQDVGDEAPILDEKLPGGERLSVCLPPTVPLGTVALTLRKHEDGATPLGQVGDRYHTDGWNKWRRERATRNLARSLAAYDRGDFEEFLRAAVQDRLNIIFAGATGVGKTTFAKSLTDAIDKAERVVTIEDTEELAGLPPNHVRLLYSKGRLSRAQIGHEELLQASMRMRPKRIIVGEMRDDAVVTWIMEACTGHPGGITTIHGSSAGEAVRRIGHLVKSSPRAAGFDIAELLADTIDVIIPLYETDPASVGKSRGVGAVWFAGDALRRHETAADLLQAA